jgi:hypothetical protein
MPRCRKEACVDSVWCVRSKMPLPCARYKRAVGNDMVDSTPALMDSQSSFWFFAAKTILRGAKICGHVEQREQSRLVRTLGVRRLLQGTRTYWITFNSPRAMRTAESEWTTRYPRTGGVDSCYRSVLRGGVVLDVPVGHAMAPDSQPASRGGVHTSPRQRQ